MSKKKRHNQRKRQKSAFEHGLEKLDTKLNRALDEALLSFVNRVAKTLEAVRDGLATKR